MRGGGGRGGLTAFLVFSGLAAGAEEGADTGNAADEGADTGRVADEGTDTGAATEAGGWLSVAGELTGGSWSVEVVRSLGGSQPPSTSKPEPRMTMV
jgi:hypothetical protein